MSGIVMTYQHHVDGRDITVVVHFSHWLPQWLGRWAITFGLVGFHVYANGGYLPAVIYAEEVGHALDWQEFGRLFLFRYLWGMRKGYAGNPWEIKRKAWAQLHVAEFTDIPAPVPVATTH